MTTPTTPDAEAREVLKPCPLPSFHAHVDVGSPDQCWEWKGARTAKGYGNFRSKSAHVVAFELRHGPVPIGLEIDHLCRNRACVNPTHLEAVTHAENVARSLPTHCKYGHQLSGDNVRLQQRADGMRRRCKTCRNLERGRRGQA